MKKLMNIEAERARLGMDKTQFSELLGITRPTYAGYISGKRPMKTDVLLRLSEITGKSINYLLGLED